MSITVQHQMMIKLALHLCCTNLCCVSLGPYWTS